MGTEYRLTFSCADRAALHAPVARMPGAAPRGAGIDVRRTSTGQVPDATIMLEEDGAYFCDHGASGAEVLGQLVTLLMSHTSELHLRLLE